MKRIRCVKNFSNTIIETNMIKTVLDHARSQNCLVVFDVDKTLAQTDQELGSEQWAFWLVKQKLTQGYMLSEAIASMLELYRHVHEHIELKPVENETVSVVNQLKERSIPVICLTGRPCNMADRTYKQLQHLGLSFECPQEFNQQLSLGMSESAEIYKGVVCVGMADKGTTFLHIMKKINYQKPEKLIFIDDKKDCVDSLSLACKRKDIPFLGLRYGYLDEQDMKFDPEQARLQLEKLLSKFSFNANSI